jgi:hypothetical protein
MPCQKPKSVENSTALFRLKPCATQPRPACDHSQSFGHFAGLFPRTSPHCMPRARPVPVRPPVFTLTIATTGWSQQRPPQKTSVPSVFSVDEKTRAAPHPQRGRLFEVDAVAEGLSVACEPERVALLRPLGCTRCRMPGIQQFHGLDARAGRAQCAEFDLRFERPAAG